MRSLPDKTFDLILTDPPYGIGMGAAGQIGGHSAIFEKKDWDKSIPSKEYFDEMRRVSRDQIIFGGNYFVEALRNSRCWLVWDKQNEGTDFSDCELAWTSFDRVVKKFTYRWNGYLKGSGRGEKEVKLHPTQKPLHLIIQILEEYAKDPMTTLFDPFAGSGTLAVAAQRLAMPNWVVCEQDPDYCQIARARLEDNARQQQLF